MYKPKQILILKYLEINYKQSFKDGILNTNKNDTEKRREHNVLKYEGVYSQQSPRIPPMNFAKKSQLNKHKIS